MFVHIFQLCLISSLPKSLWWLPGLNVVGRARVPWYPAENDFQKFYQKLHRCQKTLKTVHAIVATSLLVRERNKRRKASFKMLVKTYRRKWSWYLYIPSPLGGYVITETRLETKQDGWRSPCVGRDHQRIFVISWVYELFKKL